MQLLIDDLKQSNDGKLEARNMGAEYCSETDTEGDDRSIARNSPLTSTPNACEIESNHDKELNDDVPLITIIHGSKQLPKLTTTLLEKPNNMRKCKELSTMSPARSSGTVVGRKRVRVVLSDDEDDGAEADIDCCKGSLQKCSVEGIGTSGGGACKFD